MRSRPDTRDHRRPGHVNPTGSALGVGRLWGRSDRAGQLMHRSCGQFCGQPGNRGRKSASSGPSRWAAKFLPRKFPLTDQRLAISEEREPPCQRFDIRLLFCCAEPPERRSGNARQSIVETPRARPLIGSRAGVRRNRTPDRIERQMARQRQPRRYNRKFTNSEAAGTHEVAGRRHQWISSSWSS